MHLLKRSTNLHSFQNSNMLYCMEPVWTLTNHGKRLLIQTALKMSMTEKYNNENTHGLKITLSFSQHHSHIFNSNLHCQLQYLLKVTHTILNIHSVVKCLFPSLIQLHSTNMSLLQTLHRTALHFRSEQATPTAVNRTDSQPSTTMSILECPPCTFVND